MSTYTVTEDYLSGDQLWKVVRRDDEDEIAIEFFRFFAQAEAEARKLNLHERAEAMLALLVESVAEDRAITFGMPTEWIERRDALIAEIDGAKCGRCGKPFAPFNHVVGMPGMPSSICPACTEKRQRKTEEER